MLDRHRNSDGTPDCLVAVSGGRDSSYVLYQLKTMWGMHPIAFNYNNGFVSSLAVDNLKTLAQYLDIPLISITSRRNIQGRMFRTFLEFNTRKSPEHALNQICVGCRHGIWGGAYKIALEHDIRLIAFGESKMEHMVFRSIIADRLEPALTDKIKTTLQTPTSFVKRKIQEYQLNTEFPLEKTAYRSIKKLNYFDYVPWNEEKIVSTLTTLGWKADNQNSWRFDCQIHALANHLNQQLYGFTEKDELYSRMIREGLLDRDEALRKMSLQEENHHGEKETIQNLFKQAGISKRTQTILVPDL
jgi:7-cyano-7-deazaguanine synthase in queuosine biosynthesis